MTAILDIPADAYHRDDLGTDQPTLSASTAATLCARSPLHAWTNNPRLNPNFERDEDQKFSVGKVVHALKLEGREIAKVLSYRDWRTKEAREDREQAIAHGLVPILERDYERCVAMLDAIDRQLAEHRAEPPLFQDGKPEATLLWEEDGVACRARLDWLRDDLSAIDDLKTTSRSSNPEAYARALFGVGGDVQAAFYLRGAAALMSGWQPAFRWVVVETAPPFALSVVTPSPAMLELGAAKVDYAIRVWRECLESDKWPGYGSEVHRAECPPWELERWLMREEVAA